MCANARNAVSASTRGSTPPTPPGPPPPSPPASSISMPGNRASSPPACVAQHAVSTQRRALVPEWVVERRLRSERRAASCCSVGLASRATSLLQPSCGLPRQQPVAGDRGRVELAARDNDAPSARASATAGTAGAEPNPADTHRSAARAAAASSDAAVAPGAAVEAARRRARRECKRAIVVERASGSRRAGSRPYGAAPMREAIALSVATISCENQTRASAGPSVRRVWVGTLV